MPSPGHGLIDAADALHEELAGPVAFVAVDLQDLEMLVYIIACVNIRRRHSCPLPRLRAHMSALPRCRALFRGALKERTPRMSYNIVIKRGCHIPESN